jgi:hypothetical protein
MLRLAFLPDYPYYGRPRLPLYRPQKGRQQKAGKQLKKLLAG